MFRVRAIGTVRAMPGRPPKNPADIVLRARLREVVHFPDLTERLGELGQKGNSPVNKRY